MSFSKEYRAIQWICIAAEIIWWEIFEFILMPFDYRLLYWQFWAQFETLLRSMWDYWGLTSVWISFYCSLWETTEILKRSCSFSFRWNDSAKCSKGQFYLKYMWLCQFSPQINTQLMPLMFKVVLFNHQSL